MAETSARYQEPAGTTLIDPSYSPSEWDVIKPGQTRQENLLIPNFRQVGEPFLGNIRGLVYCRVGGTLEESGLKVTWISSTQHPINRNAWFWSDAWQALEREADLDIVERRVSGPFSSLEQLRADLESETEEEG